MNILLFCLSGLVDLYSLDWTFHPTTLVILSGAPFVPWPFCPMALLSSGPSSVIWELGLTWRRCMGTYHKLWRDLWEPSLTCRETYRNL